MINKLNDAIKDAMKSQDKFRLEVLRMMKSKIMTVDARGNVPEAEVVKILRKYAKSLEESLAQQKQFNRLEDAANTEKELVIVQEFLPPEMSEADLEKLVKEIAQKVGATSQKDMGKIMKEISSSGMSVEGGKVREIVLQLFLS